jgi:Fur family iron response transcriptional regulator
MKHMETVRPFTNVIVRLREANLRPTRQRIALAKMLFEGEDRHITAEILHQEALRSAVSVSLATVYNTLNQFTEAGLLREIGVDSHRCYFDTNTSDHHHFFFEKTNHLEDIKLEDMVLASIPKIPDGTLVKRVDIVIRLI